MASYNNPVKQKSREAVAEFIKTNAPKPLEQCKVFTLLGAERDDEVALELPMWLELGVRPENITTVERNPQAHARLLPFCKNRGIKIPDNPVSALDYFSDLPETASAM